MTSSRSSSVIESGVEIVGPIRKTGLIEMIKVLAKFANTINN